MTDILIAGGGMVGTSAAVMMARALPSRVITLVDPDLAQPPEKRESFDGRITALSCDTLRLFDGLGLGDALRSVATAINEVHVSDRGHLGMVRHRLSDNHGEPLGHVIANRDFGEIVKSALHASRVTRVPARVEGLSLEADAIVATLSEGHSAPSTQLLVIADGARSPLRQTLGIGAHVNDYDQRAMTAVVSCSRPHRGIAFERFTDQGPIALLPLDGDSGERYGLVWTHSEKASYARQRSSDAEFLTALQTAFGYRAGRFTSIAQRGEYPLKRLLSDEQVRERVVVLGNAAHSLHPVAGQGFNLSMRDLSLLCQRLESGEALGEPLGVSAALKEYAQAQRRDQQMTSGLSHAMPALFGQTELPAVLARNLGLMAMNIVPPLKQLFFAQMMGRGVHGAIRREPAS